MYKRYVILVVAVGLLAAGGLSAGDRITPPHSKAYGYSLADWMKFYWAWYLQGADPDAAVFHGVEFLPMPAGEYGGGSFTFEDPGILNGHVDLTVKAGTPFVTPIEAWLSWLNSWGEDVPLPDAWFGTYLDADVMLDGQRIVDPVTDYYIPATHFDEPIYANGNTYVFFQCIGFLCEPLKPGTHTLTNDAYILIPPDPQPPHQDPVAPVSDVGVIYHNTWTITVVP